MTFFCDHQRHLVCLPYSPENLHKMAATLGIARGWFHASPYAHYDIPKGRIDDIQRMALLVSPKTIVQIARGDVVERPAHAGGCSTASAPFDM
jgi:hypothetical protein